MCGWDAYLSKRACRVASTPHPLVLFHFSFFIFFFVPLWDGWDVCGSRVAKPTAGRDFRRKIVHVFCHGTDTGAQCSSCMTAAVEARSDGALVVETSIDR